MTVTIQPSQASGATCAPPSKSMAHRLLICAGLSKGTSVVKGVSDCEDINATVDCLEVLGVKCTRSGDSITVKGCNISNAASLLKCRESGSTLRFFLPLALISGNETTLVGASSLMQRPMKVYEDLCMEHGMAYEKKGDSITVKGPLNAGTYTLPGNISSQFISGLLFALPLVKGNSKISIVPPVESRSYIDLTLKALAEFGIKVIWSDDCTLFIEGGQQYSAHETTVEGDYSNAAFLDAFNLFDGKVTVSGLTKDSLQGDKIYREIFPLLCTGTPTIHIGNCPDLGPILFSVAAAKNGAIFKGTGRLRIKESNRVESMAQELRKFGTEIVAEEDSVIVSPKAFHSPAEPLYGHNDHRIVMSMAVLSSITGGKIEGAEAVRKSFPDFFKVIKALGIEVKSEGASL